MSDNTDNVNNTPRAGYGDGSSATIAAIATGPAALAIVAGLARAPAIAP
jgi:hypothetical protein